MTYLKFDLGIEPILESVKFDLKPGQKVALIGPNGSGKSSFLSAILNMTELKVTGKIEFKQQNLLDLSTSQIAKMGVGIINQQSVVIKNLTLRQILLAIDQTKQSQIELLAKKLKVSHLLDRELNLNYSGGEMRRAELLQLMIQDPELVLIDELDAGVDIDSRKIIYQTLNNWLKNKTAIIVSHDFEIYQTLAIDKLLVVKNKQIIEQDLAYLGRVKERGYE